jgi:hypothetical protein
MPDVDSALAGTRSAISDLIAAAERTGAAWTSPRAPGKWSPSQVVEHVARALEESANVVSGAPSKFPTFPSFVRPVVKILFFNRVLKKASFPKAKTIRALDPADGPATPADAKKRLESAMAIFERACRNQALGDRKANSTIFGSVPVEDYARFQEIHIRHHQAQIVPR